MGMIVLKQPSRNFKRRTSGDTIGKLMLTLKSLGEEYEKPVTTKEWLENLNRNYKTTIHFDRPLMLTNMVRSVINPETLETEKNSQGRNWKFEYLGGETISEWLAPNSRAKFDAIRNEIGGTAAVVPTDSEVAESFAAESTPSRDNDRVAVGDRVRSYDFVIGDTLLRDDSYIEGTVTKNRGVGALSVRKRPCIYCGGRNGATWTKSFSNWNGYGIPTTYYRQFSSRC